MRPLKFFEAYIDYYMKGLFLSFLNRMFWLANFLIPKKKNKWILETRPDFDSTCKAFVIHVSAKPEIELIIAAHKSKNMPDWLLRSRVIVVKKNSLGAVLAYFTSSVVFYSTGLFARTKPVQRQLIINVWHGMPLKKIGRLVSNLNNIIPYSNFLLATSNYYRSIMAKAFEGKFDEVLIANLPRNELLKPTTILLDWKTELFGNKKVITCLPTYRQSVCGDIRVDGEQSSPMANIANSEFGSILQEWLSENKVVLLVKPHHMSPPMELKGLDSIRLINDSWLSSQGVTLYELLAVTDLLITDVSSVLIDFLLTDRPIIFAMDDFDKYSNTRGFISDNLRKEDFPGDFVENFDELLSALNRVVNEGIDAGSEKRAHWRKRCFDGDEITPFFEAIQAIPGFRNK